VCGELFHVDGGGHYAIRLSFASPEDKNITEGIRRIGVAMKRIIAHQASSLAQDRPIERLPIV
jgi:DNA-binding transcriptional MocR family regulator